MICSILEIMRDMSESGYFGDKHRNETKEWLAGVYNFRAQTHKAQWRLKMAFYCQLRFIAWRWSHHSGQKQFTASTNIFSSCLSSKLEKSRKQFLSSLRSARRKKSDLMSPTFVSQCRKKLSWKEWECWPIITLGYMLIKSSSGFRKATSSTHTSHA